MGYRPLLYALTIFSGAFSSACAAIVVINEVLGSTPSTDTEYIELYNSGPSDVDIAVFSLVSHCLM